VPADLWLNRLTFGATPDSRNAFDASGAAAWLEHQLTLPPEDDGLAARLADVRLRIEYEAGRTDSGATWEARDEARALEHLRAPPEDLVRLVDWEAAIAYFERVRPADEVIAASLVRAVHAPAQLREVMTQFWHDHFSVNAHKTEVTAALFPPHDRMLRAQALGNFRELLGHVARSPAMLQYLNNDTSQASPANENFARELMELHTLGQGAYLNDRVGHWSDVPGATEGRAERFLDDDVHEVARAFTGWTIGDGRWLREGELASRTGAFLYVDAWHDPYQKRILGREFPDHAAPQADGDAVLDLLAAHPATGRFVTGKMLVRLGIEAPGAEYRRRVADAFAAAADAPDQIAQTVRAIVLDPEFARTPPTKLRRPFEFAAAYLRAIGADVSPRSNAVHWHLARVGWTQHQVRPPSGHPDKTRDWATTRTVGGLVDLALYLPADWMELCKGALSEITAGSVSTLGRYWTGRFGLSQDALADVPGSLGIDPLSPVPDDPEARVWLNTGLASAAALSPDFLFR
jgi:uncharacterized protein (DUF1800 family)